MDTVDYKPCVGDLPVWGSLRLAPIRMNDNSDASDNLFSGRTKIVSII